MGRRLRLHPSLRLGRGRVGAKLGAGAAAPHLGLGQELPHPSESRGRSWPRPRDGARGRARCPRCERRGGVFARGPQTSQELRRPSTPVTMDSHLSQGPALENGWTSSLLRSCMVRRETLQCVYETQRDAREGAHRAGTISFCAYRAPSTLKRLPGNAILAKPEREQQRETERKHAAAVQNVDHVWELFTQSATAGTRRGAGRAGGRWREATSLSHFHPPPPSSLKPNHIAVCVTVRFTDSSLGACGLGLVFFFPSVQGFRDLLLCSPTSSLRGQRVKSSEPCKEAAEFQQNKTKKRGEKKGVGA
ncbi:uncharacterized protein LOC135317295 [Phalacrocorax carbo]|uniref:uncharacterized protein LOC135317295 n=1 Tax=Phalacrocorax carbo TaxID=9209 RepID=UPI00311A788D